MQEYKVEDLTQKAPVGDLVASIHYEKLGGYVEVRKDGSVRLVSPGGVVSARFRELEKEEWLRNSYIQILLDSGVQGEELQEALEVIDRVDKRLAEEDDPRKGWEELKRRVDERFRQWCAAQGLDYDSLSEEEFTKLVDEGIRSVRQKRKK
jgi:hypothetical protein